MDHHLAKGRHQRQDDPAGAIAINLLAYAAMGDNTALETCTLAATGADLGRVGLIWYHMCQTQRGPEETATLARTAAQDFYGTMIALQEGPDFQNDNVKTRAVALSMARGLLICLATDQMDRFAELWETVATRYEIPVILETVALMLGFTRGILDTPTGGQ